MDQHFWNDSYRQDPDQVMVVDRILDQELRDLPVGTALDLGCGSGLNALKLSEAGWSVVGVDWAERAIEIATRSALERGLGAIFHVGDVTTWDPAEQFDLVISTYALPGGRDSELALGTAQRALAPGGTLLVAEWDRSMAEAWGLAEGDLLSPQETAELLPELDIEKAEVRHLQDMFPSDDDPRALHGSSVKVAVVRARRPLTNGGARRTVGPGRQMMDAGRRTVDAGRSAQPADGSGDK